MFVKLERRESVREERESERERERERARVNEVRHSQNASTKLRIRDTVLQGNRWIHSDCSDDATVY